jgi:hypothetical protein
MGREAVVRQRFQVGKHPDGEVLGCEKADLLAQGFRIARTLRNDDEGASRCRGRLGNRERRRRAIQLSPLDRGYVGVRQSG